jgi:hypothetical protein
MNCASTTASNIVMASVDVGAAAVTEVIADQGIVDIRVGTTDEAVMPEFWRFWTGAPPCSSGSANFLFSADFTGGPFLCLDVWGDGVCAVLFSGVPGSHEK